MITVFFLSVAVGVALYGTIRHNWMMVLYAVLVGWWLSIGVMAMLTRYEAGAVWLGIH